MGILRTDKISGLETPTAVTGSVNFPGSDDYITAPANTPELLLGDADFTIEGWFYKTNTGQQDAFGLYETANNRRSYLLTISDSNTTFYYNYTGSSGTSVSTGFTLPLNEWAHVAIIRDGTTLKIYVDGKLSGTTTGLTAGAYANTNDQFMIGSSDYSNANGSEWTGHISNLRIVKGYVLYDGDFTVPDHALEVVPGTVLLACNNSDSVTAVESALVGNGLTLTAVNDVAVTSVTPGLTRDFTYGTEFKGVTTFDTQGYFVPPSGTTTERFPDFGAVDAASARGVFGGGRTPSYLNTIDYITISTTGNAQDFGDLTQARGYIASSSSRTRGVFNGGGTPGAVNTQDFITISSTGDASNFGELQTARYGQGNSSSSTRGVFGGGNPGPSNVIEFITIATTGSTQDFGDLTEARVYIGGCSSSTRGVFGGGSPSPGSNTIDYITISSTGNATNFGDLTQGGGGVTGCSSRTRGLFAGRISGSDPYTYHNIIDYITIAALGNATDFGDLTVGAYYAAGCSSNILGVFGGLSTSSGSFTNTIDYVTIASTGDAADFGDLSAVRGVAAAVSNGHGGLG